MKIIIPMIILIFFVSFSPDCNQDISCVKQKLISKKWIFVESHGANYSGHCWTKTEFICEFKEDGKMDLSNLTEGNCQAPKKSLVHNTTYKLFIGKYDQVYVRIYDCYEHFGLYNLNGSYKKHDSIDYQFLYYSDTKKIVLRTNSKLKQDASIQNTFE